MGEQHLELGCERKFMMYLSNVFIMSVLSNDIVRKSQMKFMPTNKYNHEI